MPNGSRTTLQLPPIRTSNERSSPSSVGDPRRRSRTGGDVAWQCSGLGSPFAPKTVDAQVGSDSPSFCRAPDPAPEQKPPAHRPRSFVAVARDGCRLNGMLHGDPDAEHKVLLIMGWSSCLNYWEAQTVGIGNAPPLPALGSFEVCCFDNRGTGLSDRPWGYYSTTMMADDARAVMRCVGWPVAGKRFHIVGHSMGGMIAQEMVLRLTDMGMEIDSLTLLASHSGGWRMSPPPTSLPRGMLVIMISFFVGTETLLKYVLPVLHTKQYLRQRVSRKDGRQGKDVLKPLYRLRAPFKDSLVSYLPGLCGHTFACFTHKVNRHRLGKLSRSGVRTLVVAAGGDRIIPPSHSLHLARALGCPFHKLEGCGHMAMTEQPGLFNAFLVAHLQDHLHCHPAGRAGRCSILGAGGIKHSWRLPFGLFLQYMFLYPGLLVIRFLVLLKQMYDRYMVWGRGKQSAPVEKRPTGVRSDRVSALESELEEARRISQEKDTELQHKEAELAELRRCLARAGPSPVPE